MSVIAQADDGTLIAGGDTEGFFRSVDGGQTWTVQDAGLPSAGYRVAAILPVGTTWFAGVGDGTNGGVAESLDDGLTWVDHPHSGSGAPPVFDGTNLPGQMGNPRATGNLLATDGKYLYAASFGRGLRALGIVVAPTRRVMAVRRALHVVHELAGARRPWRRLRLPHRKERRKPGRHRDHRILRRR